MADISLSFSAEGGISLDDLVGIFTGTTDPSSVGEAAPIGSIYLRQNGTLYQKIGAANTNWIKFSQGLGEAVKITSNDALAGYLSSKLLVSSALTATVQNAGLNENLLLGLAPVGTAGSYKIVTTNSTGQVISGSNPTTLAGFGIVDAQPLATNLTNIAAQTGVGFYVRQTAGGTTTTRSITGTTNQIAVLAGDGVSGNPTLSLSTTTLFPGTTGIRPPSGTTAQRVNTASYLRYNSDTNILEYFNGTVWVSLVASTGGTVTSVGITQPASGITVTGGPITSSGTFTVALANDLASLEGLASTGFSARTAADTWATRTFTGTADRLTITNGQGIAGDPVFDIASTYVGQSSITTLGVIGSGTWQGTAVGTSFGGTGRTSIGTANQMLGVNVGGTGLEYKTIVNGTGIGLAFSATQIQINNTGVTSIAGTANQITASAGTGAVTLSLPQNINSTATPTFASVTVAADPTLPLQVATKQYVDNAIAGLSPKQSVRAGTTANIALTGLQTLDGVVLVAGDRVLVKNQTALKENGIYIVASGAWARSSDMDVWAEVPGTFIFVEEGTTLADSAWVSTANQGGTLETTAITWLQFNSASDVLAGTGLTKAGNTISIAPVGTAGSYNNVTTNALGQVISGSNVAYLTGNQNITLQGDVSGTGSTLINVTLPNITTAGTFRSVTVNAKGQVTGGTNPTTLAGYGITDAQPLDTYLSSLVALGTNGIVVKSGTSAIARAIQAGSSKVSVVNGDGVAGNPTIDVVEANLTHNNIGGTLSVAKGGTNLTGLGTANQVLGVNAGGTALEYKTITAGTGITIGNAAGAITINAVNAGTVTSVAATGSTGLTVGGSPITSSGTLTFTLGTELQGLSALSTNGLVVRTAAGTYASRSVVSGNSTIAITNPLGTVGNISLDLATAGSAGTYRSVTTDAYGRVTAGTNPTTLAGYGITDAVSTSLLGANNGVATLDASGKLVLAQLPATAITDTFVVTSQAAQLALVAEVGDVAVRTDLNKSFILRTAPATVLANWQELLTPTDTVLSVNGQTGIVNVGTVTSVAATQPAAGLVITGSPITTSGTLAFSLANDLGAVEGLVGTGFAVRTATDTWTTRTLVAGAGINIANADGTAGNITISATNSGTVTSVGLAAPSIFTVSNSPVTSSGTLTLALANQTANTVLAGPSNGVPAVPAFRTLGLAQNDLNDVTVTTPSVNQVLAYNGTRWVNTGAVGANAAGLIGFGQAGAAAWTLLTGTRYYADFAHNLGTTNVVITVFDTSTNAIVIPDNTVLTNANTVRVTVVGNTRTLKVVVVANGQSIVAGGSTPSSIVTAKDGATVSATATKLNFTGQAVAVTDAGSNTTNISIGSRFTYFANSLDNPINSDFAVNALAAAVTDPTFASLNVRQFSSVVEQGVAFVVSIPPGATTMTLKYRGRAQTAPGAASVVQPRLYTRLIPNNTAVGTWSAANELANIAIPTNANFQYATQSVALGSLGLTAGNMYQMELTRRVSGTTGTNLASSFLLAELTVEFA